MLDFKDRSELTISHMLPWKFPTVLEDTLANVLASLFLLLLTHHKKKRKQRFPPQPCRYLPSVSHWEEHLTFAVIKVSHSIGFMKSDLLNPLDFFSFSTFHSKQVD